MEVKDITIKRYIPSEGKALKIRRKVQNIDGSTKEYLYYTALSPLVVEDELIAPIEEVDMEEYNEWAKKQELEKLGITSLI